MKIMVVDDAQDYRESLTELFRLWGHVVVEAGNGAEALTHLADPDLHIVVSDWMMPEMDGIDLCRAIRSACRDDYVYVILLTGKTSREDIIHGLNAGADEVLCKPFDFQILLGRIQVAERIIGMTMRLVEQNRQLMDASKDLPGNCNHGTPVLSPAARIKEQLLPCNKASALPINTAWMFNPSATVTGDLFNFIDLGEEVLGFYQLDISGQGIPVAMLSICLCNTLTSCQAFDNNKYLRSDPSTVVSNINRQLVDPGQKCNQYITMVYGTVNKHSGEGRLCIAGHPPPFTVLPDGGINRMKPGGMPAGMFADSGYSDISFQLRPGERLVLYSDGITNCVNEKNLPFGLEQFQELLADTATAPLNSMTETLEQRLGEWRGSAVPGDDMSMLVLERPHA